MSVRTVTYAPTIAGDTNRGPSRPIWKDCPLMDFIQDPHFGTYFFDDFLVSSQFGTTNAPTDMGMWGAFPDTNALVDVDLQAEGGVLALTGGTNSGVGITLAASSGAFRFVTATPFTLQTKMWFECRFAISSITSANMDVFIGLADNTTANLTTATNTVINTTTNTLTTTPNLFGFHKRSTTNPADIGLAFNVAGGTVQYPTNLQTLVNTVTGANMVVQSGSAGAGFVKVGFVFDPNAYTQAIGSASSSQTLGTISRPMIQPYVNGLKSPAFLTGAQNIQVATFPTGFMSPVIAVKTRTATKVDLFVDWIRVAQVGNL
jgi:hypothetical protein